MHESKISEEQNGILSMTDQEIYIFFLYNKKRFNLFID